MEPPYATIAGAIRTHLLQTPIDQAVTIPPVMSQRDAFAVLRRGNFDQAPVIIDGRVEGFVLRSELSHASSEPAASAVHPLATSQLIAGDAGFPDLVAGLIEAPMLFVLEGRAISGFVTPSDVNKQPGRTHFFLLLADLELSLSEAIRTWHPEQEGLLALLRPARAEQIRTRRNEEVRDNVDADLVADMTLIDLFTIVEKSTPLLAACGYDNPVAWRHNCNAIETLRNAVMHPVRPLLGERRTLADLQDLDATLRRILEAVSDSS
jgi:hypothetical protein